jgi:hypothetical protein
MREDNLRLILETFINNNKEYGIGEICVSTNDGLPITDVEVKENLYNVQEIAASSALISNTIKHISSVLSIKDAYMVLILNNSMQICVITRELISIFILSQKNVIDISDNLISLCDSILKELLG